MEIFRKISTPKRLSDLTRTFRFLFFFVEIRIFLMRNKLKVKSTQNARKMFRKRKFHDSNSITKVRMKFLVKKSNAIFKKNLLMKEKLGKTIFLFSTTHKTELNEKFSYHQSRNQINQSVLLKGKFLLLRKRKAEKVWKNFLVRKEKKWLIGKELKIENQRYLTGVERGWGRPGFPNSTPLLCRLEILWRTKLRIGNWFRKAETKSH